MNSDLRSWKTQFDMKFLQEITKFFSNPLLRTLTSKSLTSFQLTHLKKIKNQLFYITWCAFARLHLLHHHHHHHHH